jgi:hypothetical protein
MDVRLALSRGRQDGRAADNTLPLTERILARLPGPRGAWVLAWAAVPMAAGIAPGSYLTTVGAESIAARLLLLTGVAFAYAVVLAFWAVARLTSQSKMVERSVEQLAAHPEQATTPVFRPMASTQGPLALTLVFVALAVWRTAALRDPWTALLWSPVSLLINLPLLTAVWVYLALLLGLNRLGRRTLSLTAFPEDLSLGVGEVGRPLPMHRRSVWPARYPSKSTTIPPLPSPQLVNAAADWPGPARRFLHRRAGAISWPGVNRAAMGNTAAICRHQKEPTYSDSSAVQSSSGSSSERWAGWRSPADRTCPSG